MGSKMESIYNGKCEKCGKTWVKGNPIFYQKGDGTDANPKLICTDQKCFELNGGKISEWKPEAQKGQSTFQARPVKNIEQKLADIDVAYAENAMVGAEAVKIRRQYPTLQKAWDRY